MIILPAQKKVESVKRDKAIKTVYCLYRVSTKNQVDENDIPTKQLKTLYSEVPDSISGNSAYSPVQLSDIINDLKDKIDNTTEKLEALENERTDKQQLQMSIQHRYEKYHNLLLRFFEKGVGDDEKRMIILKLFERITISKGTKEYDINFTMRSDYADFGKQQHICGISSIIIGFIIR